MKQAAFTTEAHLPAGRQVCLEFVLLCAMLLALGEYLWGRMGSGSRPTGRGLGDTCRPNIIGSLRSTIRMT